MLAKGTIALVILATAGCISPDEWSVNMGREGSFGGVDFGSIEILSVEVRREASAVDEVAAHARAVVRIENADAPRVAIFLDDRGCSARGPPREPASPVAREWRELPRDRAPGTHSIDLTLRGSAQLGLEGSIFVWAEAANSIGPIFGECREFKRAP